MVEYEWDEAKRLENQFKHQIDFSIIHAFQWNTSVRYPSPRFGEMRWLAIGFIDDRLYCVIYTDREERRRIISLRKANARDRRRYEREH